MENIDTNNLNKMKSRQSIHHVLAHSYSVYFILLLIGISLDFIFNYDIFPDSVMVPAGLLLLLLASGLILWAQKTGNDLRKIPDIKTEHFCRGPYCYTRIPTQWGLLLLILGFGIITNSLFIIITTIVSFLIAKFVFISKHDIILTEKYGDAYKEYKKLVRF